MGELVEDLPDGGRVLDPRKVVSAVDDGVCDVLSAVPVVVPSCWVTMRSSLPPMIKVGRPAGHQVAV
jgi:hypothetical protein